MRNNRKRLKKKMRKLYVESRKCPVCGGYDSRWYIRNFEMCFYCYCEEIGVPPRRY